MEDSSKFQGNQLLLEVINNSSNNFKKINSKFQIVITIFEYLSIKDIKNASVTCKKWLSAAMHASVMDRRVLCLNLKIEDDKLNFIQKIKDKPILSYNSFKIEVNCHGWLRDNQVYDYLRKLSLESVFHFLNQFENIYSLDLSFNDVYDDAARYEHCLYDSSFLNFTQLKSVKVLRLVIDGFLLFCYGSFFLELMPALEHIDIQIGSELKHDSCSCCEKKLQDYLIKGKNRIRTLILDTFLFEPGNLLSTVQGMNLTTTKFLQNLVPSHINLTDSKKLRHLSLLDKVGDTVNTDCMDLICQTYSNLETLSVISVYGGIKGLRQLKKLKVSFVEYWASRHITYNLLTY